MDGCFGSLVLRGILCRRRAGCVVVQVGVVEGGQVAGSAVGLQAEEVVDAAGVSGCGVDFVEDAVFADGSGQSLRRLLVQSAATGVVRGACRSLRNRWGLQVPGQRWARWSR